MRTSIACDIIHFYSHSTPLRFLKHYKIPKLGVPSRLLVGTADGTIRLLSPISGNTLTIAFPVVDSEQIKSAVYSVRTNKIFLLLHNLEIWVIATNVNPCMVIDIWKRSDDDGDDECTILDLLECNDYEKWPHIAQSNFPLRRRRNTRQRKASTIAAPPSSLMHGGELLPKSTATPRRCTFLIGGTPAGHLIVYGKDSKVVHRMLIHHGEVSSISINSDLGLIATGSVDDQTVRLTQFNPTAQQMFAPLHLLAKNIMPMMLNCSNVFTAIGNNDGTVMIVRTADGHVIRAHPKVDDHNGAITSLVFLPKQEVFVSSSADGLIKVWQCEENILLRELQFAEPVLGLTRANGRGDVLVAFGSRVEFISAHALLPSALARFAIKDESSAKEPEQPLPIETAAGVNLYKWRKIKAGDVSAKVDELFEEVLKFGPQHKSPSTTDDNTHAVEKEAYEEQRQLLEELDIGGLVVPIRVPSVKKLDEVVPISVINDGIDDVNESAKAPIKLLQSFVDRINERHKQMIRFHEAAIEEEKNARLGKAEDKCDEAIPTVQANEVTAPVVKSVLEADLEAMPVKKLADLFQSLLDGEKTDLSKLQQVLDEKKMAEARRKAQERRMASDAKQKQKYAVNRQQQEIVILRRLRRAGANTRGSVKQQAQVLVTRRNEPLPRTVSSNNASSGVTIREEELRLEAIRQTVLENERKIAIISSNYKARLAAFVQESEEQETAASDALNVVDESAHSNDKPMNAAQAIMSGRPPPRPLTPNYFRKPRPPLIEELLREPWIQEQDLYDMELSWEGKWRHRSAVRRLLCAASGDGVAPILLRLCKEAAEDLPKRSLIVKYIARMAYDNLFEKSPPIVAKQLCWFLTEQYDLTQLKAPEIELRVTLINALLLLGVETKEVMTSIALQTASLDERLRSCAMEALQILGFYENGAKAIAKHSNKIVADVLEKDFMGLPMSTPPQDYFAERVSDVLDSQERSQTSTLQSERVQVASRPASERRILRHQERLDEFARASAETMESRTLPTTPWVDEQTEETEKGMRERRRGGLILYDSISSHFINVFQFP